MSNVVIKLFGKTELVALLFLWPVACVFNIMLGFNDTSTLVGHLVSSPQRKGGK